MKYEDIIEAIDEAKAKFNAAEKFAKQRLIDILKQYGEQGVIVATIDDNKNEGRVCCAELDYADFRPITFIRYFLGNLEVLVTNFDKDGNVTDTGQWKQYNEVIIDTWYLLDVIEDNIREEDNNYKEKTIY